jgi:hypothetical protein
MVYLGTGGGNDVTCLLHIHTSFFAQYYSMSAHIRKYPSSPEVDGTPKLNTTFVRMVKEARKKGRNALVVFEDLGALTPSESFGCRSVRPSSSVAYICSTCLRAYVFTFVLFD